jgi:hypothetical protein
MEREVKRAMSIVRTTARNQRDKEERIEADPQSLEYSLELVDSLRVNPDTAGKFPQSSVVVVAQGGAFTPKYNGKRRAGISARDRSRTP